MTIKCSHNKTTPRRAPQSAPQRLRRRDHAGGPAESQALKTELHAKRPIASEGQGKRQYFTVKPDIPGLGRVRVIALRAP
jgi:hypothetical protein